jgi:methanogenic corrinoid protein MtbC1
MINVYEELGETSRRMILSELRSGPKSVSEIVASTGLKQPNVSNHLARMRTREIVRANKVGRQVYYQLASPEIEAIVTAAFAKAGSSGSEVDTEDLAKVYARAAVQGDEATCNEVLDRAFRAQMALLDIYQDILAPAMQLIGTWYKVHAIDEAQEHMASAITERMMARTVGVMGPSRRHGRVALLGCAPNAWHVIGLRMISDFLRLNGWKTLFLGANVPAKSFMTAVEQHHPNVVLLSLAANEGREETMDLIRQLSEFRRKSRRRYLIGVGGPVPNEHPRKFTETGADFVAPDLRTFASEFLPEIERSGSVAELQ